MPKQPRARCARCERIVSSLGISANGLVSITVRARGNPSRPHIKERVRGGGTGVDDVCACGAHIRVNQATLRRKYDAARWAGTDVYLP